MNPFIRLLSVSTILASVATIYAAQAPSEAPVAAVVESSLESAPGQIRQFALDGNNESFFASAGNPTTNDHFTMIFDKPIALKSISTLFGRPKGGDELDAGVLEISLDGKTFNEVAKIGLPQYPARADAKGQKVLAIRVRPTVDMNHPLAIRELTIESSPPVAVFKYPIEFIIDVGDAPEMKEWAEKVVRVCERNYAMINEELKSEGFKPRTVITMRLKSDYKGVAAAGGGRITGSVTYFKKNPNDVGAMVHETVHCVQDYRTRGNPGWLVEGIADYVRFFKYEPGKIGKMRADPHYNNSYRVTAAFLNYVTEKYDKELVRKLNHAMREGEYKEEIWRVLTKKSVQELDEEWRESMKK